MSRRPGFPLRLDGSAASTLAGTRTPVQVGIDPDRSGGIGLDSQAVRARMVQRLAAHGIADAQVMAAMGAVERHRFVDTALVNQAYEETSLPIGLGQTISKPNVVGRMIELLLGGARGPDVATPCGWGC